MNSQYGSINCKKLSGKREKGLKLKTEKNESDNTVFYSAVVLFVGLALYEKTKYIDWKKELSGFIAFSKGLFLIFVILIVASVLLVSSYRILSVRKTKNREFKSTLESFIDKNNISTQEIEKTIYNFNALIQNNQKLAENHLELRKFVRRELNIKQKELHKKENEEIRELKLEKRKREKKLELEKQKELQDQKSIKKLTRYFEKKNSEKSIPKWATKCDSEIINEASRNFKNKKNECGRQDFRRRANILSTRDFA